MLEKIQFVKPEMIEARSSPGAAPLPGLLCHIRRVYKGRTWPEPEFSVVKRCIHTSADFDYADNLCFSKGAAALAVKALKEGVSIVTDTRMAASGRSAPL